MKSARVFGKSLLRKKSNEKTPNRKAIMAMAIVTPCLQVRLDWTLMVLTNGYETFTVHGRESVSPKDFALSILLDLPSHFGNYFE
jgi:hypothetical protein